MKRFPQALKAARHLSEVDPRLKKVIARVGPMKVELDPDETLFESFASSIIYQQLHGKAAATILKRFQELFKTRAGAFPSPRQVVQAKPELLRTAGLSASKSASILDLAAKVLDGTVPERKKVEKLSDLELIEAFTQVRGIGPWTAQMVLIFTLGRPNVWPKGDYGVRRGFALIQGMTHMPTEKEIEKLGEKYHPFASAAAWYCWRATEFPEFSKVKFR